MSARGAGPEKVLVFCSFEVGGLPYRMAEILNRHGVRALYVSVDPWGKGHDSKEFHYGGERPEWDRTPLFRDRTRPDRIAAGLEELARREGIRRCFATGHRSWLLKKAGVPYVYWSYGSDLDQICFFPFGAGGYPVWRPHWHLLDRYPKPARVECRRSLRGAEALVIAPYQLASCRRLGLGERLRFFPHFLDLPPWEGLEERKKESRREAARAVGEAPFFFSSARQVWAGERKSLSDNKGNDVALRAFREYLRAAGDGETRLVLVEKGEDAEATRELSRDLGVGERVVWVGEMPRPRLLHLYRGARLCLGQFATPCLTFAALEPLAQGTPCASWFDWEGIVRQDLPYYREPPPIVDSMDPERIAAEAAERLGDPELAREWSRRSWNWVRENCTEERFVEGFLGLFADGEDSGKG